MRRITRTALDHDLARLLQDQTDAIAASPDPGAAAGAAWTSSTRLRERIRVALRTMSSGRERCMYCEDSAGTDVDHFYPQSRYPLRVFDWLNHILACAGCNRRKSNSFPLDGEDAPLLIDPTIDDPAEHLVLSPSTGRFEALDERGEKSIQVYDLNRPTLVQGRLDAWRGLQELIVAYCARRHRGDAASAEELFGVIARQSFATVFVSLLRVASTAVATAYLSPACIEALGVCPEISAAAD